MKWLAVRRLCEEMGVDYARQRDKLRALEAFPQRVLKQPGRNGRHFEMLCIPAEKKDDFIKLCAYKRGPYKKKED